MLVVAQPIDACVSIQKPPLNETNRTGKWVVVIARNNCSYERKIRMAQAALFDAAIVHNVASEDIFPMSANNSDGIFIPSVFVSENSGLLLRKFYANNNYYLIINSEVPFNLPHLLVPFAIVVGICFIVMIIFMVRYFLLLEFTFILMMMC